MSFFKHFSQSQASLINATLGDLYELNYLVSVHLSVLVTDYVLSEKRSRQMSKVLLLSQVWLIAKVKLHLLFPLHK